MKRGYIVILLIGIVTALLGISTRYQIEKDDTTVQLVYDIDALVAYLENKNYLLNNFLAEIAVFEIEALAIPERNLWEVASKREILIYPGSYLLITEGKDLSPIDFRKFYIRDNLLGPVTQRLGPLGVSFIDQQELLWSFEGEYPISSIRRKEADREPTVSLFDEAVYPDYQLLELAEKSHFDIVARIQNPYRSTDESLSYIINQWQNKETLIIFQGKEVLGYPDNLQEAAQLIKDKPWGFVEFANQYGEKELARLTDYNIIRVHSITPQEMEKIEPIKAENRYLRAVRERGARILYLRPFPHLEAEENLAWLKNLKKGLEIEGYKLGKAAAKPFFKSSFILFWPVVLGIVVCGVQLMHILGIMPKLSVYSGLLALGIITVLYLKGYTVLARQISAFGAAIIFPTLAVGKVIEKIRDNDVHFWRLIPSIFIYTGVGVLFLTASLLDLRFIIKVDQFLGVKLMHLLPPVLVFWIGIRYLGFNLSKDSFSVNLKQVKNLFWPLKLIHFVLFVFLLFVGFVYIGRTGHDLGIPVLKFEEALRIYLEKIFVIRPRLKESFIGHPLLVFGLLCVSASILQIKRFLPFILAAGSIGVTSVLNTFSHAHTPLVISLIRTAWGVGIGFLLGVVMFYILRLFLRMIANDQNP